MSSALGDSVYINPLEREGDIWTGRIVDRGVKASTFGGYSECDWITYHDKDIVNKPKYEGSRVHNVMFQNIRKIQGVY